MQWFLAASGTLESRPRLKLSSKNKSVCNRLYATCASASTAWSFYEPISKWLCLKLHAIATGSLLATASRIQAPRHRTADPVAPALLFSNFQQVDSGCDPQAPVCSRAVGKNDEISTGSRQLWQNYDSQGDLWFESEPVSIRASFVSGNLTNFRPAKIRFKFPTKKPICARFFIIVCYQCCVR